ncbi:MAG TPA: hypothetical protein ENJ55_05690 [Rhizobiales bacterium]|nr:hypothetical protein [Hyphomicrobiales bacterium]
MARRLEDGDRALVVPVVAQIELAIEHYDMMMSFYGIERGVKNARKHLGWLVQRLGEQQVLDQAGMNHWRQLLMQANEAGKVIGLLRQLADFAGQSGKEAA